MKGAAISPTYILLNIVGGVALLLWALKLVRLGVTRGFGANLRSVLAIGTKNRFLAALAGAGVTTLLQSSLATIMIISSFAGQSMLPASSALALILGADVGTTIVAQLLTFDLSWLTPLALIVGVILFTVDKGKSKNIGRIIIGLGLLLLSLRIVSESSLPMKESETLPLILAPLQRDMIFAILVAGLMAWVAHSSLAIVLLLASLAGSGVLPGDLGLVMVLGVNLGATIAPLVSTLRDAPAAIRVTAGNMMMRFIGVLLFFPSLHLIEPLLADLTSDPARQVVNFHMIFNISVAVIFLPFTGYVSKIVNSIIPDRIDPEDPKRTRYLNIHEIDTPAIALASAERETLRLADELQDMMEKTIRALRSNDAGLVQKIRDQDNIIDSLYNGIKHYLARLSQEAMDKEDSDRFIQILTFATNLEHAGDVIDKNLMALAMKKIKNHGSFSAEGSREIQLIHDKVLASIKLAQNIFVSGDIDLARKIIKDKENIREAEMEAYATHIERLRDGVPETIATSSLHLDIIRDYRRINSYMCTVAYPLLEQEGQIRSTRLRKKD